MSQLLQSTRVTDEADVRALLDHVVDDLTLTVTLDHEGYLLDLATVQGLVAFLSDVSDMHDERAIDVEIWPTLAGFVHAFLAGAGESS